jgi:DtxR family Mn-dependent transcriptional regulator
MVKRIQIEDALKHVHECAARDVAPTIESVAGALGIAASDAALLVAEMEAAGWLSRAGGHYALTRDGRIYARHVIRAHRIYEAHLASETGIEAARWHRLAERLEHRLSNRDVEAMSRRLGDPRFDPHGDPIPTTAGELPSVQGVPLIDCPAGCDGVVTHIEDEPESVYREIVASGVAPGMRVRVQENTPSQLRVNVEGVLAKFSRAAAANVLITDLPPKETFDDTVSRLSSLRHREKASVVGLLPTCRGPERRRFLDLGVVPGTAVEVDLVSPSGDPTAYMIRGASIALRRTQAERILIRRTAP